MGKSTEPLKTRQYVTAETLTNVYHCRIHDATRKLLTINVLGVFRVVKTPTLKTVKYLSLSNLQVALRPLDKGAAIGQQGCPREDLTPWSCFFIWTLSQTLTLCVAFTSSTYLLPQRGGQNRLFCPRHWIHVCKYDIAAHVRLFLNGHGGTSGLFAPVVVS